VEVGAPKVAGVPVCVFACVSAQLSADATLELLELLELLDEVLLELVDELLVLVLLDELTLLEELTELVLLDEELIELLTLEELELTDKELLDEILLEALPDATVAVVGSDVAPPPLHAETSKPRLLTMLTNLKRVRVFMVRYRNALRVRIKCSSGNSLRHIANCRVADPFDVRSGLPLNFL